MSVTRAPAIGAGADVTRAIAAVVTAVSALDRVLAVIDPTAGIGASRAALRASHGAALAGVDAALDELDMALFALRQAVQRRQRAGGAATRIDRRVGPLLDAGVRIAAAGDDARAAVVGLVDLFDGLAGDDVLAQRRAAVSAARRITAGRMDLRAAVDVLVREGHDARAV
jgi:hypothetical protein